MNLTTKDTPDKLICPHTGEWAVHVVCRELFFVCDEPRDAAVPHILPEK